MKFKGFKKENGEWGMQFEIKEGEIPDPIDPMEYYNGNLSLKKTEGHVA